MEFLGNEIGGRFFPTERIFDGMLMFTFGVGEDISFELEMARMGVRCICFDPTPKSIQYMKQYPHIEFKPWGLFHKSMQKRFYYPKDPNHVSCSIGNLQGTTEWFKARCITLEVATEKFGIPDIVKMDIEGAEYKVIDNFQFWPEILMVEFHGNKEKQYADYLALQYGTVHKDNHDYLAL
jgi:FkbM family methyltransferase